MLNSIKDFFTKLTKPTTTVANPTKGGFIDAVIVRRQKEILSQKTNQDMINAFYKVADTLKTKGGPWPLLRAAGLGHLTDNREAKYSGPAIDELIKLSPEVRLGLKKILGIL